MDNLLKELHTIDKVLDSMSGWGYLTDEDKEMEIALKKRKTFFRIFA